MVDRHMHLVFYCYFKVVALNILSDARTTYKATSRLSGCYLHVFTRLFHIWTPFFLFNLMLIMTLSIHNLGLM
jgi:hypothetical protein